mgnify:FL=1
MFFPNKLLHKAKVGKVEAATPEKLRRPNFLSLSWSNQRCGI